MVCNIDFSHSLFLFAHLFIIIFTLVLLSYINKNYSLNLCKVSLVYLIILRWNDIISLVFVPFLPIFGCRLYLPSSGEWGSLFFSAFNFVGFFCNSLVLFLLFNFSVFFKVIVVKCNSLLSSAYHKKIDGIDYIWFRWKLFCFGGCIIIFISMLMEKL